MIEVIDTSGVSVSLCPAENFSGLFDPTSMTGAQIDSIRNLFECGPLDVPALATALNLLCQSVAGSPVSAFYSQVSSLFTLPFNVVTPVPYNNELFDLLGDFDTATFTWTPPAGLYLIGAGYRIDPFPLTGIMYVNLILRKNTTDYGIDLSAYNRNPEDHDTVKGTWLVHSNGADVFQIGGLYSGVNVPVEIQPFNESWFWGVQLSQVVQ